MGNMGSAQTGEHYLALREAPGRAGSLTSTEDLNFMPLFCTVAVHALCVGLELVCSPW